MPHVYTSAVPEWIPELFSGTVVLNESEGPAPWDGPVTGVNLLAGPATTFERPRGTSMNGISRRCWSGALPVAGVATTVPREVWTAPSPTEKVSSLSRAASFAAVIEAVTLTV